MYLKMKKFIITEEEKDEILGQHKEIKDTPMDRRMLDSDLTPMTLAKIKSKGMTPYYIKDTELIELSGPIKQKSSWDYKPTEVFLFTPDDYDKIKKLSDNINQMIELKKKQIELYKQYIPSVAIELTKKK
jgi:hypothetical protein